VQKAGERVSTLDLFGQNWVLLADDARWVEAAAASGKQLGIEVTSVRIGSDVQPANAEAFRAAFGIQAGGASLIRPDGHVAWRSVELPNDPAGVLVQALRTVACAARG
jgi:hypothetical protein